MGRDGRLIQLVEKDLQSKLEILFKKNFYDVAIKVSETGTKVPTRFMLTYFSFVNEETVCLSTHFI